MAHAFLREDRNRTVARRGARLALPRLDQTQNVDQKDMKSIRYRAIGTIRTQFKDLCGMPIQPTGARRVRGTVEVATKYQAGLKDLRGFSHVILLYHFHRSRGYELRVRPFMDSRLRGVFATRAPRRPNPIGLSVVRLVGIRGRRLRVEGVDIVDGTPLLDIKPYVPEFDHPGPTRIGWLKKSHVKARMCRSDDRFIPDSARGANL